MGYIGENPREIEVEPLDWPAEEPAPAEPEQEPEKVPA